MANTAAEMGLAPRRASARMYREASSRSSVKGRLSSPPETYGIVSLAKAMRLTISFQL